MSKKSRATRDAAQTDGYLSMTVAENPVLPGVPVVAVETAPVAPVEPAPVAAPQPQTQTTRMGMGVVCSVTGNILTLTVDLSKEFGLSSSGKNTIVASTGGNVSVAGVKIGLNVYKK